MKKLLCFLAFGMACLSTGYALERGHYSRALTKNSVSQRSATSVENIMSSVRQKGEPTVNGTSVVVQDVIYIDEYEQEKEACLNNNVGVGNTFVWASRYGDTNNYANMVEDVSNLENNACFALVSIKSVDDVIDVADLPKKYVQWGENVTCGSWIDEEVIKQRILDAKKTGRILGTIGATIGGVGLGVGIMEAFGNKLIGGKVQGQLELEESELLLAKINSLTDDEKNKFCGLIKQFNELCKNSENVETICKENDLYSDLDIKKVCNVE